MYVSGRPSCCVCVKNRLVVLHETWYEGISWGTILCLDFKVKGHRLFGSAFDIL